MKTEEEFKNLQDNFEAAQAAYKYAIKVIENYQLDIRLKTRLVNAGFCQGSIYLEAKQDILRIASRT
jgi:hypothetical protein